MRTLAREGIDRREVMASLRPSTPRLWETVDVHERRRFLRHARAFWDTHRHRVASDVWQRTDELRRTGRLVVLAGRISACDERPDGIVVSLRRRGTATLEQVRVGTIVNCTGPESELRCVRNPLLTSLLARGVARPDALGLGLKVDANLALRSRYGASSHTLRLVGPLLRGRFWEATAVPELRVHAARVAREVPSALDLRPATKA